MRFTGGPNRQANYAPHSACFWGIFTACVLGVVFDLFSECPKAVFLVSFLGFFMSIAIDSEDDAWRILS